ncbi:lysosomal Pro-X carboxypeptidase-like [Saccoglossus kowalevskii]
MVIFAEHRYYGESLPFGNESFSDLEHVGYLTSEQALADFATLIKYIKSSRPGADKSPVIVFGGSYGGMMAAWFRMKYPNIVDGALAASAPIWQFPGLTPCNTLFTIITQDFVKAGRDCAETIHKSWNAINRMKDQESGRQWLTMAFHLCTPLKTPADVNDLSSWLSNTWFNLAMVDYPYPASFLEPLPAWPIKKTCSYMTNSSLLDKPLLNSVASSLQVYYNTTGKTQCFNISQDAVSSLGELGWSYQSCTEMVMPSCSDGVHDMFPPNKWNFDDFVKECQNTWGVTPRADWIVTHYGGKAITASSNIIFSNGELDPWSGGGVLHSLSETLIAIVIKDGAHHLDLRSKDKGDPQSVIDARNQEKYHITKWIQQARAEK